MEILDTLFYLLSVKVSQNGSFEKRMKKLVVKMKVLLMTCWVFSAKSFYTLPPLLFLHVYNEDNKALGLCNMSETSLKIKLQGLGYSGMKCEDLITHCA